MTARPGDDGRPVARFRPRRAACPSFPSPHLMTRRTVSFLLAALGGALGCGGARSHSSPAVVADSAPRVVTRLDGRTLTHDEVAATVERLMTAGRVPGLALAILDRGEIVYQRAFGYRDVERRLPLTDTTVMYAASFTKSMFAYMVMQLVEEGVLDLDRPVERYLRRPLPEYPDYADLARDARYRRITPRMLLSHTSGFRNWRFFSPAGALDTAGTLDIHFEPGSRYSYSGEGIQLLQLVVEEVTGRSTADLMRERVFDRFGMTRTSMLWDPRFAGDVASGYDEEGKSLGHRRRKSVRAAGSMDTDLADVARFARGVLRGEGLRPATRTAMLSPQIRINSTHQFPTPPTDTTDRDAAIGLAYGLGWGLLESPYGRAYFKEGHDDGTENYMIAFDGPKRAMVIMTNSSNGESIFTELLAALLGDTYTPSEWERYVPYDSRKP